MRTKTLLLTAALVVAGLNTAAAEQHTENGGNQVFSVNAVGFVNVEVAPGFSMIANPLQAEDNTVASLFSNAPDGTVIYKWDAENGMFAEPNEFVFGEWSKPDQELKPGEGAFINNPTDSAFSITFVGEVMQGTLENELPTGFSMKSSMVPQSGQLQADLGFPATDGDVVYQWDAENQTYLPKREVLFGSWDPQQPEVSVGEAFWVQNNTDSSRTWTREFSVTN